MIYNHDAEKVDLSMFTDSGYQKKEIEQELVMHHIKKDNMKIFISEYIAFETAGWKEFMHA